MRVFLDASAAAKAERTGVGHYTARLAAALLAEDPSLELVLGVRLGRWRRVAIAREIRDDRVAGALDVGVADVLAGVRIAVRVARRQQATGARPRDLPLLQHGRPRAGGA